MNCCYCETPLPDQDERECVDKRACSKRVGKRAGPIIRTMAVRPFVGFNPDKAYRETMRAQRGS